MVENNVQYMVVVRAVLNLAVILPQIIWKLPLERTESSIRFMCLFIQMNKSTDVHKTYINCVEHNIVSL